MKRTSTWNLNIQTTAQDIRVNLSQFKNLQHERTAGEHTEKYVS